MRESDQALVARARGGDAEAYAILLRRHGAALARACARTLGDAATAADVAQDAALIGWLQLDRLREPARFGAWLAGIGRMLARRARRERAIARDALTRDGSLPERPPTPATTRRNGPCRASAPPISPRRSRRCRPASATRSSSSISPTCRRTRSPRAWGPPPAPSARGCTRREPR